LRSTTPLRYFQQINCISQQKYFRVWGFFVFFACKNKIIPGDLLGDHVSHVEKMIIKEVVQDRANANFTIHVPKPQGSDKFYKKFYPSIQLPASIPPCLLWLILGFGLILIKVIMVFSMSRKNIFLILIYSFLKSSIAEHNSFFFNFLKFFGILFLITSLLSICLIISSLDIQ